MNEQEERSGLTETQHGAVTQEGVLRRGLPTIVLLFTIVVLGVVAVALLTTSLHRDTDSFWVNDSSEHFPRDDMTTAGETRKLYGAEEIGFYEWDGRLQLRDTGYYGLDIPVIFEKADPASFIQVGRLVGFDDTYLHFAEFDDEAGAYRAISIALSTEELRMLRLLDPEKPLIVHWVATSMPETKTLVRTEVLHEVQRILGRSFLIIGSPDDIVAYVVVETRNHLPKVHSTGESLLLFTDTGVYHSAPQVPTQKILDIPWQQTAHRPGSPYIYYVESYSGLPLYSYNVTTQEVEMVRVVDGSQITASTRLFLSPDESHVLTKISRMRDEEVWEIVLIDITSGIIHTIAESDLLPIAVSPDNATVFAIEMPYEGYLFSSLQYYSRIAQSEWDPEPVELDTVRIEVGGGWNIDTRQWLTSPLGNFIAFADATNSSVPACAGFLTIAMTHNSLKVLNLSTRSVEMIKIGDPLEKFILDSWLSDESGFYYRSHAMKISGNESEICTDGVADIGRLEFIDIPR